MYYKKAGAWTELQSDLASLEGGSRGGLRGSSTPFVANGYVRGVHSEMQLVAPSELKISVADDTAASEFQLLHLHTQSDRRTFRSATDEGLKTFGPSSDAVKFKAKEVAPKTYLLSLPALTLGEYGLLAPYSGEATSSSRQSRRLYTFRVVKE